VIDTTAAFRAALTPRATHAYLWSDAGRIQPGAPVTLNAAVGYGSPEVRVLSQAVQLEVLRGTGWTAVATARTSTAGFAVFTVRPTATASYRLSYPGHPTLASSTSPARRVTVVAPASRSYARPATLSGTTAASGTAATVLAIAASLTGRPYSYAAAGPNAFDCSGFTQYVFRKVGISLPHNANAQNSYGTGVSRSAARPGDLVFFLSGGHAYHVGIYAGNGYMYDAPHSGTTVGLHKVYGGTVAFRRLL
jgi:cell wall-associated NlpC family hydrolase